MRDISNKADNVGDTLPAEDFNSHKNEFQNLVDDTYQTLDPEGGPDTDLDQAGKAIALYGSAGDFYADSGAANAYVLARSTTLQPVPSYRDGLAVVFTPGNTNTGASTVNVSSLGVKNITLQDGSALSGGELIAGRYYELRYNLTNDRFQINAQVTTLPKGYIDGLIISNNGTDSAHDIDLNVGICRSTPNDLDMTISSILTKQIDANWAEGNNQGGFPSGLTLSADTWYHFFIIGKADGSQFDAGWDTSTTAANLLADATAYSTYRRVGSILTDSSSNIIPFLQTGDEFELDYTTLINDYLTTTLSTTPVLVSVTVPPDIKALYRCLMYCKNASTGTQVRIYDPDISIPAGIGGGNATLYATSGVADTRVGTEARCRTNTSQQIYIVGGAASTTVNMNAFGWQDSRGKDGN